MSKFHIKESGEPGACEASVRDCPRGGENEHYDTKDDARRAYEKVQEGSGWAAMKKQPSAKHVDNSEEAQAARAHLVETAIKQENFNELNRQWEQARVQLADPSNPYAPTPTEVQKMGEQRDVLAKELGFESSASIEQKAMRETATAMANEIESNLNDVLTKWNPATNLSEDLREHLHAKRQAGFTTAARHLETVQRYLEDGQASSSSVAKVKYRREDLNLKALEEQLAAFPKTARFGRRRQHAADRAVLEANVASARKKTDEARTMWQTAANSGRKSSYPND